MNYTNVLIGSSSFPLPIYKDRKITLNGDEKFYISLPTVHEGTPEEVQKKVIGSFWRNLTSRSLLPRLVEELGFRNYNIDISGGISKGFWQRDMFFGALGSPGIGKTYMYEALGKLQHPKGAILIDCTGFDFNKLFVETVLDTANMNIEKNAINARLVMYNKGDKNAISSAGLDLLKNMMGKAFVTDEDTGSISINWNDINMTTDSTYDREQADKEFVSLLQQFCKKEKIETSVNMNSVGFTEKDGPLIRTLDPQSPDYGRPIILDEVNRNPKNIDRLYGVMNFLTSFNRHSMVLTGANGKNLTITRESLPQTFIINANGNPFTQEMGTSTLNQPFLDRVSFPSLPSPSADDFTDLVCSMMTGVPIAIIQESHKITNEKTLSEVCKYYRTLGLSKNEVANIPEDQNVYLQSAAQFLVSAKVIGMTIFDFYQLRQKSIEECEDAVLRDHIVKNPISPRTISKLFSKARNSLPKKEITTPFNPLHIKYETPIDYYGISDRLENLGLGMENAFRDLARDIFTCAEGDKKLSGNIFGTALKILTQNGIGPQEDERFTESRKVSESHDMIRLGTLMSFHPQKSAHDEAIEIQKIMCEILRAKYESKIPSDDNSVVDPLSIECFLIERRENIDTDSLEQHPFFGTAVVMNPDSEAIKTIPMDEVVVIDSYGMEPAVKPENLVTQDAFLLPLCLSETKQTNLQTLWPKASGVILKSIVPDVAEEEFLKMMIGTSQETKIAVLSLLVGDEKSQKSDVLDIIHNQETGKTLIVGNPTRGVIKKRLKEQGIVFIERDSGKAENSSISQWVNENIPVQITKADQELLMENIITAFKILNGIPQTSARVTIDQVLMDLSDRKMSRVPQVTTFNRYQVNFVHTQEVTPENIIDSFKKVVQMGSR